MKHLVGILLILMLLSTACNHTVDSRLACVSELADNGRADSAITILRAINSDSLNEFNRHYYRLMSIKALDKADYDISQDTTISDIVAYFERFEDESILGEAYYYGGRVCREQGDAPQALDYYQKALDVLQSPDHLYRKGKIASQMGQIFLELYMFDQAKPKFQEAIAFQTQYGDSIGLMYNYKNLGETYQWLGQYDSVKINYDISLNISKEIGDFITQKDLELSKIDCLLTQGNYTEAKKAFISYLNSTVISSDYELMLAINIYLAEKDYARIEKYAKMLLKSKSINTRKFANSILSSISKKKNNINEAYNYLMDYRKCVDTINTEASRNAIIHQSSLFNYIAKEKENISLKETRYKYQIVILFAIIICLIIIVILILLYISNRNLKVQLSLQLSKIDTLLKNSSNIIDVNTLSVEQLRELIQQRYLELISNQDRKQYIVHELILNSLIYKKFKDRSYNENSKIETEDWIKLDELINEIYPEFRNRIELLCNKLSQNQYRVSMLIKCKFAQVEIADIMNMSEEGVSSMRRRLSEKCFSGKNVRASDWDKFIYSIK